MLIRVRTRAQAGCIIAEPSGIRIVSINQSADPIYRLQGKRKRNRWKNREKKAYRVEKYELAFFSDALTAPSRLQSRPSIRRSFPVSRVASQFPYFPHPRTKRLNSSFVADGSQRSLAVLLLYFLLALDQRHGRFSVYGHKLREKSGVFYSLWIIRLTSSCAPEMHFWSFSSSSTLSLSR